MIIPILILSTVFIAIAFIVNENNADQLLSGYNTMSKEEKENFDIKSYLLYFRNFHLFLGSTLLVLSLFVYFFVNKDWSGIFMGTYPILAYTYFIWKGNNFSKTKTKKQQITTYVVMGVMLLLFLFLVYEFKSSFNDNEIIVDANSIEITGEYGIKINKKDLKSVELINHIPKISTKINGFALETIKKGYFRTAQDEKVTLLINSDSSPIILLITKDNYKIYYSSKNKSNEKIFIEIRSKMGISR